MVGKWGYLRRQLFLEKSAKFRYYSCTFKIIFVYLQRYNNKEHKKMEDLVLSIPAKDAAFIETLASRMGWTMRKRRTSVERFINSCPKTPLMTDEEIQTEINAVRMGL